MQKTIDFLRRLCAQGHSPLLYDYDAQDLARELRAALSQDLALLCTEAREAAHASCFDAMHAHARALNATLQRTLTMLGMQAAREEVPN